MENILLYRFSVSKIPRFLVLQWVQSSGKNSYIYISQLSSDFQGTYFQVTLVKVWENFLAFKLHFWQGNENHTFEQVIALQ